MCVNVFNKNPVLEKGKHDKYSSKQNSINTISINNKLNLFHFVRYYIHTTSSNNHPFTLLIDMNFILFFIRSVFLILVNFSLVSFCIESSMDKSFQHPKQNIFSYKYYPLNAEDIIQIIEWNYNQGCENFDLFSNSTVWENNPLLHSASIKKLFFLENKIRKIPGHHPFSFGNETIFLGKIRTHANSSTHNILVDPEVDKSEFIESMVQAFPNLREVTIYGSKINSVIFSYLIQNNHKLKTINLFSPPPSYPPKTITERDGYSWLPGFPPTPSIEGIIETSFSKCTHLTYLNLSGCLLSTAGWESVLKNLPSNITYLNISHYKSMLFLQYLAGHPHLKKLDFSYCHAPAENWYHLSKNIPTSINTLYVARSNIPQECVNYIKTNYPNIHLHTR